jgi:hypothetical protein
MARPSTVEAHPRKAEIDAALLSGTPYRDIAGQFDISKSAIERYVNSQPEQLTKAQHAHEVASADVLLGQVEELRSKMFAMFNKMERAGNYATAIKAARELRAIYELLLETEGRLNRAPQVNVLLSPEWGHVRGVLLAALIDYPDARASVAAALEGLPDAQ